jgi:hypothetical protein
MPTSTGGETIDERLARLRIELTRVRATIERHENNGASFQIGGSSVTQIAYDRAIKRERDLEAQIRVLEARKTGSRSGLRSAQTITRMD